VKITHPIAIGMTALLASAVFRGWMGTLDVRYVAKPAEDPTTSGRPLLYLFWHEHLLLPAYTHASRKIPVLISQHRDGELIAQVVRMLRGLAVRGSTTRGGAGAMREMIRQGRLRHLAITPDGPRGPRRVLQDGAIYLASRTGMAIVPAGCAFGDCWRVRSWDRFAIPKPGTRAHCLVGNLIEIPPDLDRDGIEEYRQRVQADMDRIQAQADQQAGQ